MPAKTQNARRMALIASNTEFVGGHSPTPRPIVDGDAATRCPSVTWTIWWMSFICRHAPSSSWCAHSPKHDDLTLTRIAKIGRACMPALEGRAIPHEIVGVELYDAE
jgi:hypothetical protein